MLSPDDYTQPVASVAAAGHRADGKSTAEIDSKIESKGAGPKMISFTLPAFGLVCATVLIGFACAFVIGRMTNTPVQAANVEPTELPATPVDTLQESADVFDINPETPPEAVAADGSGIQATAAANGAITPTGALWGFQVIQYKIDENGEKLAMTYRDRLQDKGFSEVFFLKKGGNVAVIVGANPSFKALEKAWKEKLLAKSQRADPIKFTGDQLLK